MYRVPHRLYGWWRGLDGHARVQASLVFLIGLLGLAHYLLFCIPQQFFIEDSAISFAYARNLVDGHGLVTYPGGERVEGYSNPTWTFLIALFYAMGVPVWTSAKKSNDMPYGKCRMYDASIMLNFAVVAGMLHVRCMFACMLHGWCIVTWLHGRMAA